VKWAEPTSHDQPPKTALFETPAPAFDCLNTDSFVGEDTSKFSMYRFVSLPLQQQELDHAYLSSIH
jgi:hypothetical protein